MALPPLHYQPDENPPPLTALRAIGGNYSVLGTLATTWYLAANGVVWKREEDLTSTRWERGY